MARPRLEEPVRLTHDFVQAGRLEFAYARLAMIEEAAGNKDAKRAALDRAKAWDKRLHGREQITDERLKNAVRTMDQVMDRVRL
jgi:hypothetical protein